jgi:hypothetical protein
MVNKIQICLGLIFPTIDPQEISQNGLELAEANISDI